MKRRCFSLRTRIRYFGHKNILRYCNRPFTDVDAMNEGLVSLWNAVVDPEDTVYHLGDFAMGGKKNLGWRSRLNGRIILVKGNHDWSTQEMLDAGFDEVHKTLTIEIDGKKIYLAHIPVHLPDHLDDRKHAPDLMPEPPEYDYFLCGHVHGQWRRQGTTINVGTDVSSYMPLTFTQLLERDNA